MAYELWCFYRVQGEAADDDNAFRVWSTSETPSVRDLMTSFSRARPNGERGEKIHWRIRVEDPSFGYCWQDVTEEHIAVAEALTPTVYAVYARLVDESPRAVTLRLTRARKQLQEQEYDDTSYEHNTQDTFEHEDTSSQQQQQQQQVSVEDFQPNGEHDFGLDDKGSEDDEPGVPQESLLNDIDDDDPAPTLHQTVEMPMTAEEVQEAVLKRKESLQAAISDNQREAREELRRREEIKASEELEFERLRAELGPKLKAWSEEFGKKKNIRALLADMDKVMWPEANWQPISIADLLQPGKVKRAYYKASRYVHPDKLVGLTVTQRFIGQTIFDALTQAYADFENSGQP